VSPLFGLLSEKFLRLPYVVRLIIVVAGILIGFGSIIHFIEPNQFPTIFDGVWWAIITTSTIGYGDYVPITFLGRSIGILLVLIGVGFVSNYFVALATTTVKKQNNLLKGTMNVEVNQHFIVIGWNERTREMIEHIHHRNPNRPIVLIDSTLEKNPFERERNVYFLHGNAFSEEILKKANVKKADAVLITADAGKAEIDADMQTVLTIVAIKGLAPNTYCIAEILTKDQIVNAKRAGVDEVIPTNKFTSSLMLQSMTSKGISRALLNAFSSFKGVKLDIFEGHPYSGQTFRQVNNILLEERKILIGFIRKEETIINPNLDEGIYPGDQLLYIGYSRDGE